MQPSREQVWALLEAQVANEHLRRHMLATEAIMHALAPRLGGDPVEWSLAGLGHDLDSEQTEGFRERHGLDASAALARLGASAEVVHAVAAHNPATGIVAESAVDIALLAADQLSGLITAAALVRPDKSLAGVQVKSLRKRFRETAFARGVDRQAILRCEDLDLPLDDFFAIGLTAMQSIAAELSL
jgi:predicted hydrolase (HD superfamily)